MIDRETADRLLMVGHGIGVLTAHSLLRSWQVFRDSEEVVAVQVLADAYRDEGEPHVADAIEEFVRQEYAKVRPAIEGSVSAPQLAP